MQVKVTPEAVDEIKRQLREKGINDLTLRIYIAGNGWGGPVYGLAPGVPAENDKIFEVEEIKFIFPGESSKYTKGFQIDFRGGWFGKRLIVEQIGYNGHSCG